MIKINLSKFSNTEYLIVKLSNPNGEFEAEVMDCLPTLKQGLKKLWQYRHAQEITKDQWVKLTDKIRGGK